MENKIASASSMHPMLWVAAISVTLLSFAGIASLTGLLPLKSEPVPAVSAPVASVGTALPAYAPPPPVPTPAPATADAPVAPVAQESATAAVPPVAHHKTAKKKVVAHNAPSVQSPATAVPPPLGAGVPPDYAPPPPETSAAPVASHCANCGVVSSVRQISREGQGSGLGAVAGGVLGGVLGNNVGNGNGRTLATIAGAVGGGFLGNKVEKTQRQTVGYQISVRMEDGSTEVIEANTAPPWRSGDHVKLVNGAIVSR